MKEHQEQKTGEEMHEDQGEAEHEDPRKAYEHEEWYQKWLRRQEHRPRKIIYIGGGEPQDAETHEQKPEEQKPEDHAEDQQEQNDTHGKEHQHQEPEEKSYEHEEWYQKWLRRQKNRPRQIIDLCAPKQEEPEESQEEPKEQKAEEEQEYTPEEWAAWEKEQEEERKKKEQEPKPYENEEWYQKWLRRQKNKGRQIIEIGGPQEQTEQKAEEEQEYTAEEWAAWEKEQKANEEGGKAQATEEKGEADQATESKWTEETQQAEPEKKPYEQEEWYQKWLRRQANKPRQIIEIG